MKRGAVIGIAAGAVALVAAGGILWWMLGRAATPEQTAETYLRALSEGDAGGIRSLLAEEPDGFDTIAEVFEGADGYVDVASFEVRDDRSVRAEVVFGDQPAVVGFTLAQTAAGWRVTGDFLATLTVSSTIGDAVRVGGVLVPTGDVLLLPARYDVVAAPAGLVDGTTTVDVTNDEPVSAAVEASVSPAATAAAQQQLDAYLSACTRTATSVPDHCGLRVPWAADLARLDEIAFRVDTPPVLSLSADAGSFAATGGVIVATATGTTRDGAVGSFTYRAEDWALRGIVSFSGDTMTLGVG